MMVKPFLSILLLLVPVGYGFGPPKSFVRRSNHFPQTTILSRRSESALAFKGIDDNEIDDDTTKGNSKFFGRLQSLLKRTNTLEAAGFCSDDEKNVPLVQRGFGFRRFLILVTVGMAYKWYRARFINKIPFWEKQPQWNMVVSNKEQEEQLRAYTCLNCGSSIFIARNREWFFEGGTGIGGLGCYACGAKGKENFVMDRDRIVEDVGEDDDYFAYERPLDFVSAAERKKLLKATEGDEEAANQILTDKATAATGGPAPAPPPMFGISKEEAEKLQKEKEATDETKPAPKEPEAIVEEPSVAPPTAPKPVDSPDEPKTEPPKNAIVPPAPPAPKVVSPPAPVPKAVSNPITPPAPTPPAVDSKPKVVSSPPAPAPKVVSPPTPVPKAVSNPITPPAPAPPAVDTKPKVVSPPTPVPKAVSNPITPPAPAPPAAPPAPETPVLIVPPPSPSRSTDSGSSPASPPVPPSVPTTPPKADPTFPPSPPAAKKEEPRDDMDFLGI